MTAASDPAPAFDPADPSVGVRLRRLFETDLLGIFFFGYDGSIPAANDTFLKTVGYSRADLEAGRIDWAAMTPPEFAAQDAAKVIEVRQTGRCKPFEKEYRRRDGMRVPVLLGAAGVDGAGGVCFALDLTERRRAERERARSDELRQAALDVAEMGVCWFDLNAKTVTRDARAAVIGGREPHETGPYPLGDLFARVRPEDLPTVMAAYEGGARGERSTIRFRWVRPNGDERLVRSVVYPVRAAAGGTVTSLTVTIQDVTDVEAAVRRTRLLAEVLEETPDFVGVASADGRAEFVNAAGRAIVGLSEAEVSGLPVSRFHEESAEKVLREEALGAAREAGRWTGESVLRRADGVPMPVSQSIIAHRDAAGEVTHYSTICRDLTERVRAEDVNAARQECLTRLAAGDPLPDVLAVLALAAEKHLPTPNLVCILLRGGAADGVLPAPAEGKKTAPGETLRLAAAPSLPGSFHRGVDGLPADESGGACGAAAARGERVIVADLSTDPLCEQFREFTAEHNLRAVWSNPVLAADGAVLGTFAVYHDHAREPDERDLAVVEPLVQTAAVVVERAAADARAENLRGRLAAGEAEFRGTFENVGVGVAHVGLDGAWLRVNQQLCEIVGYPEAELRTKTFQQITHPDDLGDDLVLFGKLLEGEVPRYSLRKRYFRKDGSLIWIQLTVAVQRGPDGKPKYAISVIDDISDLVAAEEELRDLNASLELKVQARTQRVREQKAKLERLARGLADAEARERRRLAHAVHDDLQQILAAAKFSAVAAAAADPTGPAAQTVELLDEAMNEARSLTQDLVPTVLYDRGLVPAIAALCRRIRERFRAEIDLVGDGPDPGGGGGPAGPAADLVEQDYVWGPLMFQAARELLFNATKHAPGAAVTVTLGRAGGKVRLTVENGPPTRPALDDGPDGRAADGGFGLFSLREQAALAGGRLKTTMTGAGGFRVAVTLPAQPFHARTELDVSPPPPAAAPPPALRVMIVDDHRIVRMALAGLLNGADGVEVVGQAEDGQDAVDRVADLAPDAVVMDVTMPRMDGIEATRRVKALLPHVRIVGLSMHTRDDMAEAMCSAGAAAYVPKGGPPDELLRALHGRPDPDDKCC